MFNLIGGSMDTLYCLLNFLVVWNTIAINVDFHSAIICKFVLCFPKVCTFSKLACLSASSLFFLRKVLWYFLMHLHSYFIDTTHSELVFKDITRSFCEMIFFPILLLTICFFVLHPLESASSPNDAELLDRPPHWCFLLTHSCLIWALSKPCLPTGMPLRDLNKGTQLLYKCLAKCPVSLLDLLVPMI